jgi:hypothetical protein
LDSSDANTTVDYAVVIPNTVAQVTYVVPTAFCGHQLTIATQCGVRTANATMSPSLREPTHTKPKATIERPRVSGTIDGQDGTKILNGGYGKACRHSEAHLLGETFNAVVVALTTYNP